MRRLAVGLAAVVVLATAGHARGTFIYTTLDVPGSRSTTPEDIDGSNVVGNYWDSTGKHGFLYDGSAYTTLDPPGSRYRNVAAIDGSNVVGGHNYGDGQWHGFLYDGSSYTTLDPPGSTYTIPRAIDGSNVVGYYEDALGVRHGFLASEVADAIIPEPSTIFIWSLLAALGSLVVS